MRKIYRLILGVMASLTILSGCGNKQIPETTAAPIPETTAAGPVLLSSWVGSHHTSNAMGDVVSGHLLNFYDDGTVKIYYGIKAGIQGHHFGTYTGLADDQGNVKYTYFHQSDKEEIQGEFHADLNARHFQAKIFCMASFPNSAGGGIHYVRIPAVEPDDTAQYIYCGSKIAEDSAYGLFIQLKDGKLSGAAASDGAMGGFSGDYEVVYSDVTDIDTPDQLYMRYPALARDGETLLSEGEQQETVNHFNDTSFLSYTPLSLGELFPRIPLASIVNQDGTYNRY